MKKLFILIFRSISENRKWTITTLVAISAIFIPLFWNSNSTSNTLQSHNNLKPATSIYVDYKAQKIQKNSILDRLLKERDKANRKIGALELTEKQLREEKARLEGIVSTLQKRLSTSEGKEKDVLEKTLLQLSSGDTSIAEGLLHNDMEALLIKTNSNLNNPLFDNSPTIQAIFSFAALLQIRDVNAALPYYALATDIDKNDAVAWSLLGNANYRLGKFKNAKTNWKKSLEIYKRTGNYKQVTSMYDNLDLIYESEGDLEQVENFYLKEIKKAPEIEPQKALSSKYRRLGKLYKKQRKFNKAKEYFSMALEIDLLLEDDNAIFYDYTELASISIKLKAYNQAKDYFTKISRINENKGCISGVISNYGNIGLLNYWQKQIEQAETYLHEAISLIPKVRKKNKKHNHLNNLGLIYVTLGKVYKNKGETTSTCEYWNKALNIYKKTKNKKGIKEVKKLTKSTSCF